MIQDQCIGFLNTPPLWENREFGIQQFEFPTLDLKSFQAQPIPQNIRLGHQMEYVFKQLLDYSSDYEVLLHNLPIKDEKRTLGEIDFILKNLHTQKLIHVELTCKFYIINPEIKTPLQQLTGPNKRDLFFAKMEKIRDQQFPLLHTPEGIKALENNGIAVNKLAHQCCFKAQLYVPYGDKQTNLNPLNEACIVGYWLRSNDLNTTEFKAYEFYIPNKSQWVIKPHNAVTWLSHSQVLHNINQYMLNENAPMVWMRKSNSVFEKFFVIC